MAADRYDTKSFLIGVGKSEGVFIFAFKTHNSRAIDFATMINPKRVGRWDSLTIFECTRA